MGCNKNCKNDKCTDKCDPDCCDNKVNGIVNDFLVAFKQLTKNDQVITFHKLLESFYLDEEDLQ